MQFVAFAKQYALENGPIILEMDTYRCGRYHSTLGVIVLAPHNRAFPSLDKHMWRQHCCFRVHVDEQ